MNLNENVKENHYQREKDVDMERADKKHVSNSHTGNKFKNENENHFPIFVDDNKINKIKKDSNISMVDNDDLKMDNKIKNEKKVENREAKEYKIRSQQTKENVISQIKTDLRNTDRKRSKCYSQPDLKEPISNEYYFRKYNIDKSRQEKNYDFML